MRLWTTQSPEVWRLLEEEFSPQAARALLEENPGKILNNEEIPPARPVWFE